MKTQIRKYGNSKVIVLDPEFIKYHKVKVGDWVDTSDLVFIPTKKNKGGKRKTVNRCPNKECQNNIL